MQNTETTALLGFIKDERMTSYSSQTSDQGFTVGRHLNEYLYFLPEFEGKDLLWHIKEMITLNQEPALLDAGCGDATFLIDLARLHPQVRRYGISAFDYRRIISTPLTDIDYRVGDLHRVKRIFSDVRFDFIATCATFSYLGDPLTALKQCYGLLKEGGIIFLDRFGVLMTKEEISRLSDFWRKHQIKTSTKQHFEDDLTKHSYGLAIKRSASSHLPLPFKYNLPNEEKPLYTFVG